jgi:hypothetical protein
MIFSEDRCPLFRIVRYGGGMAPVRLVINP